MSTNLPKVVAMLVNHHEAWVVGSAADPKNRNPRDWDIIVPFSTWQAACALIPFYAHPNTFGGWKWQDGEFEIDCWPGELGWLFQSPRARFAWQPRYGARLVRTL